MNVNQIKLPKKNVGPNAFKHVLFEDTRKNSSSGLMNGKIMLTEIHESNLALSNLQTLKSIINSEYSEMDSQIREDLENMIF